MPFLFSSLTTFHIIAFQTLSYFKKSITNFLFLGVGWESRVTSLIDKRINIDVIFLDLIKVVRFFMITS